MTIHFCLGSHHYFLNVVTLHFALVHQGLNVLELRPEDGEDLFELVDRSRC